MSHDQSSLGRSASSSGVAVGRVGELVAPLPHPAVLGGEQPVHRALRAQVAALVEQRRPDLRRRAVDEPLRVQQLEHRLAFGLGERPRRRRPRPRRPRLGRPAAAVDRRRRGAQRPARRPGADDRRQLLDRRSIIARCSSRRPWSRASAPRARRRFPGSRSPAPFSSSASARSSPPRSAAFSASRGSAGFRPRGCRAPPARPPCAACATTSDATCTAPRGATARRPHPAGCTPRPRAGSAACTRP